MHQLQMLDDNNEEGKVGKSEGGEGKGSRDLERLDATSEEKVLIPSIIFGNI